MNTDDMKAKDVLESFLRRNKDDVDDYNSERQASGVFDITDLPIGQVHGLCGLVVYLLKKEIEREENKS